MYNMTYQIRVSFGSSGHACRKKGISVRNSLVIQGKIIHHF